MIQRRVAAGRVETHNSMEPAMNKLETVIFEEHATETIRRDHSFIRFKFKGQVLAVEFFVCEKSSRFIGLKMKCVIIPTSYEIGPFVCLLDT